MHVKRVHRSRPSQGARLAILVNTHPCLTGALELASFGTQPETLKLQQVCCSLVTLQSSSRYQDAFTSLAPA